jgi:hypothetical protein
MSIDSEQEIESLRAKLADLQKPTKTLERRYLEAEIHFEEMKLKTAYNVRLGRLQLKCGRQIIFRQSSQSEIQSVRNAPEGAPTIAAWNAIVSKALIEPSVEEVAKISEIYPLLDQELSQALQAHNASVRSALPGK